MMECSVIECSGFSQLPHAAHGADLNARRARAQVQQGNGQSAAGASGPRGGYSRVDAGMPAVASLVFVSAQEQRQEGGTRALGGCILE